MQCVLCTLLLGKTFCDAFLVSLFDFYVSVFFFNLKSVVTMNVETAVQ